MQNMLGVHNTSRMTRHDARQIKEDLSLEYSTTVSSRGFQHLSHNARHHARSQTRQVTMSTPQPQSRDPPATVRRNNRARLHCLIQNSTQSAPTSQDSQQTSHSSPPAVAQANLATLKAAVSHRDTFLHSRQRHDSQTVFDYLNTQQVREACERYYERPDMIPERGMAADHWVAAGA